VKVLIIGGGGREHALAWACARSPLKPEITCAPGNGGTARITKNVQINAMDLDGLVRLIDAERFDLVIVGPDDPLAAGIVDRVKVLGIPVFGPTASAARIESSKAFSKKLMAEIGVPTARFAVFTDKISADRYLKEHGAPIVVKASGLALGKGVLICNTLEEAYEATEAIFTEHRFGDAGNEAIVEEFLIPIRSRRRRRFCNSSSISRPQAGF
jgi:phosphoribosylamine--glycine ligase